MLTLRREAQLAPVDARPAQAAIAAAGKEVARRVRSHS